MDDQQSDKSLKKISDLIENLNKWLEKETIKRLEYRIEQLERLLNEMAKKIQEKDRLPGIEGYRTYMTLYCNESGDKNILCEHDIKTDIYNREEAIGCFSDIKYPSYKIRCTNYRVKASFELSYSISLIEDIKNSILGTLNIIYPGVITHIDDQFIHIRTSISAYLYKPRKKNPEISIDTNSLSYDNDRLQVEITWHFDKPSKS
jgi:hypothetical protein